MIAVSTRKTKPSGTAWLGEVPDSWTIAPLSHHFVERKETVSDVDFAPLSVTKKGIVPQLDEVAKTDAGDNRKLVRAGDIAINSRSDRKGSSGLSEYDGSVSVITTVMTPRGLVPRFAHYLIRSVPFQEEFYRWGTGIVADLWSTRWSAMKQITLAIPPVAEQQAIADFLDRETAEIDAFIADQERLIELLTERRAAGITAVVLRGLDHNVLMTDSGVDWIGLTPREWLIRPLRAITGIERGRFSHRPRNDPAYYGGDYPFIQTGDIARSGKSLNSFTQTLNDKGYAVSRVFPRGTPVMAIAANIGDVAVLSFDACAPDSVLGFFPNETISADMLYYTLMAMRPALIREAPVNTQGNLSVERLAALATPVPSTGEQLAIISHLDGFTAEVDAAITDAHRAINLSRERRAALITAAVTGQIDVRTGHPRNVTGDYQTGSMTESKERRD